MRCLYFDGRKLVYRRDRPLPERGHGQALVRVIKAGICAPDLEVLKGYMAFKGVPGHEFAGIVEQSDDTSLIGARVAGEINLSCGSCVLCIQGLTTHCRARTVLGIAGKDGAFAEYLTLPERNLHVLPDTVTDDEAVFIEPLAAACRIIEQNDIKSDDRICVLGDGRLGLLSAMVLLSTGCKVLLVGKHEDKLTIARGLGIDTILLRDMDEKDFDLVIDCTGSASGITKAMELVRPTGTIVLKTTVNENRQIDLNELVINEIKISGSRCGPFPPAIKALSENQIDVTPLVSARFPLEEGIEAFDFATRRDALKVIIEIAE